MPKNAMAVLGHHTFVYNASWTNPAWLIYMGIFVFILDTDRMTEHDCRSNISMVITN